MCYTYDSLNRVRSRTIKDMADVVISSESYTYDAAGNITDAPNSGFIYDNNNRLTTFNGNTVSYDMDGNMLSDGCATFEYDSANRLLKADGHTYTYNAEDVRIRNLCSDADTTYTYNTNCKLSQLLTKTTNGITTKYVYGNGLIGEEKCGEFKTYHFDFRGSTVAITDQYGNVTDTFKYDTYGNLTERTGNSFVIFGYNGRDGVITDKNGLIYMRARYYSPAMRRFINADILHGQISDSTSLNRYSYVNGNPVSFVDPFGLAPERGITPSPLEAAYMAQHIYSATNKVRYVDLGKNFGGWVLEEILVDDNGFKMGLYSKTVDGKTGYTIVNKGTTTWNDWGDNFTQPFGWSSDMKRSIDISEKFCNNHSNSKVTFVGHSKGGAEAAANAVANNCDAILFNPATVNLFAYGLDSSNYDADMITYIVEGEILNKLFAVVSIPIGEKETIKEDNFVIKLLKSSTLGQIYDLVESFSDHSIQTVIDSLIKEGYR